jgi:TolB-like protein/Tfp pilus assembly protein PilF
MIGKTISHYKILEKLGDGGMGEVFLAEDTKLKRKVALKFLPKEFSRDPEAKKRFMEEARSSSHLDHNNICVIYDIKETDDGQLFIIMNYCKGDTLLDIIKGKDLTVKDIIKYITQIAKGLEKAHSKEIVHCDVKPTNIIITDDGVAKIVDFGIAKIASEEKLISKDRTSGTIAYMSPEQISNANIDNRSDIWSLGVVFYEMLTKQVPFKDSYNEALMYSIMNEEPESIVSINPDVSPDLEKIVLKMLKKNPVERYENIAYLLNDIKKFPKRKLPKSIAVLPFSNTRADPDCDYLGFALADQVIGDLLYLKNITVRASSTIRKYENQVVDPLEVGKDLKVNYIVSGNFLQEGDVIRLNVELIEMLTNEMIWRTPIEVEYKNAFKLQDIVSDKVIKGLKIQFSQDEIDRMQSDVPQNPLAYEYYLRSLSYPHTNEGRKLAIEMLEKSIDLDPNYALSYDQLGFRISGLAHYGMLGSEETKRAESYYLKALSINSNLLSALGNLATLYTNTARIEKAVELTNKMLEINPNKASTRHSLGYIYRYAGMLDESITEMEKAEILDPNTPTTVGITYIAIGDYDKAFKAFERQDPNPLFLGFQGIILYRRGKIEQVVEYFDRSIAIEPEGLIAGWVMGFKALIKGNINEGLKATRKIEQANIADSEAWYHFAENYALLGDKKGCIRTLQRAVDGGYFNYPFMLTDSFFDSVRDDLEFQKILELAKKKHLAFKKKFF